MLAMPPCIEAIMISMGLDGWMCLYLLLLDCIFEAERVNKYAGRGG